MKQEHKELLLKDLCARLPYDVKIQFNDITSPAILKGINKNFVECDIAVCELEDIKLYLFPLTSMTDKQKKEYIDLRNQICYGVMLIDNTLINYINFCYENHLDINNLIPNGLAIDCTNLNIY